MLRSQLVALFVVPCALIAGVAGVAVGVKWPVEIRGFLSQMVPTTKPAATAANVVKKFYTCAMHRQVIREQPGQCPICHMELVELDAAGAAADGVLIDPVVMQNMGVRVAMAKEGVLQETLRAVGSLMEPEQNHKEINLRVSGWIEKLYANQEGMHIQKGAPLFDLYSPELTAAADELIAARKNMEATASPPSPAAPAAPGMQDDVFSKSSAVVLTAARRKLELLGLSTDQVEAIAKMDKAPPTVQIVSPMDGHIAEKMVVEGSAVKAGEIVMKVADRSTMWLIAQVYEDQLPLVEIGAAVQVKIPAVPGKVLEGKVDFVYPHLDMDTRTAKVRVVLENADHRLHENMYGTAEIQAVSDGKTILVPREAVIDTGVRQMVYVAQVEKGRFDPVVVKVGRTGKGADGAEVVQILDGLDPNEMVVTSGQFLLDSESRIEEATRKQMSAGLAVQH